MWVIPFEANWAATLLPMPGPAPKRMSVRVIVVRAVLGMRWWVVFGAVMLCMMWEQAELLSLYTTLIYSEHFARRPHFTAIGLRTTRI